MTTSVHMKNTRWLIITTQIPGCRLTDSRARCYSLLFGQAGLLGCRLHSVSHGEGRATLALER